MRDRVGPVRRWAGSAVAVALVASTACLPVPDAVIAAACSEVFDVNDPSLVVDDYGVPEGIPPEVFERVNRTLGSIQSLSATALWPMIASMRLTDSPMVEVGVVGDIAGVTTILEQWVPYPEYLEIADATDAASLANSIVAELRADLDLGAKALAPDYLAAPYVSLRDARTVVVSLAANPATAAYADALLTAHGNRVMVLTAGKAVTSDDGGTRSGCLRHIPRWVVANAVPEGVDVRIKLDRTTVARGEAVTGALIVTNRRRTALPVWDLGGDHCGVPASQPVTTVDAQYTVNGSGQGMNHGLWVSPADGLNPTYNYVTSGGAVDLSGLDTNLVSCSGVGSYAAEIPAGATAAVPFRADTFSMQPGADITLPPGGYVVRPLAYLGAFNLVALPPALFAIG